MKGLGDINMKGKKSLDLSCRCCSIANDKDEIIYKIHQKEIDNALEELYNPPHDNEMQDT